VTRQPATVMYDETEVELNGVMKRLDDDTVRWWLSHGKALKWKFHRHDSDRFNPMMVGKLGSVVSFPSDTNSSQCWHRHESNPLAKLHSAALVKRKRGAPARETMLEIFPDGYEHFDEILLSALILERLRLGAEGYNFQL
jgi:hypothetical protein